MENRHVTSVVIYDPGQDAVIPVLKVPAGHVYTVERAYLSADRAVAASGTNIVAATLLNAGTAQSGTSAISSTITSETDGLAANTPVAFSITSGSGDLQSNEWLVVKYDETGTVAPGLLTVTVEYVDGIGSKA